MTDAPFHFDGCTIFGPLHKLIFAEAPPFTEEVCRPHDLAYWEGGTMLEKLCADINMLDGFFTAARKYSRARAWFYRASGVVAFLLLWILLPLIVFAPLPRNWRWGGGWNWPRHRPRRTCKQS